MEAETKHRTVAEMHSDTRILINVLETALIKNGEVEVSYKRLSDAILRDVQNDARGLLYTAKKHVEQEHGITIETVRTTGLKRTADYAGIADQTVDHIRKTANRTSKRIITAMAVNPPENPVPVNARLSALGALGLFTRRSAIKQIEGKVEANQQKELPTAETLRLFEGTK